MLLRLVGFRAAELRVCHPLRMASISLRNAHQIRNNDVGSLVDIPALFSRYQAHFKT
jgi:hypothetical protein